jgi:GNAT superfamily N-acetyltransferase
MRSADNNNGSIRISTAEDVVAAAEIERSTFGDKAEPAATLLVISRVGDLLGIELHGKLIASKAVLYGAQCALSVSTCVDRQSQGLGYGTQLALTMEQNAKSMGLKEVLALVAPQNGPQLSIYLEKLGWRIAAYKAQYYPDEGDYGLGGDRFIIAKTLSETTPVVGNGAGRRSEPQSAFASRHEVAATRKIEAQYRRQPSSVFFLGSMDIVGRIYVERSAKKVVGFFGVLRGKLGDAYLHGPFTERSDCGSLLKEAEAVTMAWGANTVWSVVPDYDRETISNLEDAGYAIIERACGLCGGSDLLRFSKDLQVSEE